MSMVEERPPWEELAELVHEPSPARIEEFLADLPPGEAARAVSRLTEAEQSQLLTALGPEAAADLLELIPDVQAAGLLGVLPPEAAAAIVEALPSDAQADLLSDLEEADATAILEAMAPAEAEEADLLRHYPNESAGGLMITEFLAFPETMTAGQVVDDLRSNEHQYRDYEVQYGYVISSHGRLSGVLRMHDLLFAPPSRRIADIMIRDPLTVSVAADLDALRDLFDQHSFIGVPVVDEKQRLVGVVLPQDVESALGDRADSDYLKSQGVIREELRTMPVLVRSRRRLAWLSVNILLNVLAASVIAFYQDTLSQVIALAVFLPIISDMSGCSGSQAVAVSMRELTMGLIKPNEMLRVWLQEISVGLINGFSLGLLIASVAWLWQGNAWLGLVVGGAMGLNTMIAVSIGGVLPLVLKRLQVDPALASGPVLTTITDMCGFFLVLSLASAMLSKLTG